MNHKPKPCKGTGLAKGYGCGTETIYRKYGLCKSKCYPDWLLHSENGKIKLAKVSLKHTDRAEKPKRDLEKAKAERRKKDKLGTLKNKTQVLFNRYIRLRDEGKPCISSNNPYRPDHDAGHCFPVGSYDGLRFDYDNVHGQSIGDNRFKEGNHQNYLVNLPNRIGEERTKALIQRARNYKMFGYKFTRSELMEIQEELKRKIKELSL